MDRQKFRPSIMIGAVAVLAATAWANTYSYDKSPPLDEPPAVTESKSIELRDSLSPNETVVATQEAPVATERQERAPVGIVIEERRLSPDERIQGSVMEALASLRNVSGQIGVESHDSVVTLSGWTMTSGQSLRAEKAAARIDGVRGVVNEIRPKVGAITS